MRPVARGRGGKRCATRMMTRVMCPERMMRVTGNGRVGMCG
jgi:hypothetical protein